MLADENEAACLWHKASSCTLANSEEKIGGIVDLRVSQHNNANHLKSQLQPHLQAFIMIGRPVNNQYVDSQVYGHALQLATQRSRDRRVVFHHACRENDRYSTA